MFFMYAFFEMLQGISETARQLFKIRNNSTPAILYRTVVNKK